ncbi:MSMEG_6728 family protein [Egicoccus sp. AB-alg2]|uniref:MSMEG_6728 family protein n=1 Tax=Egicoccus sp. AB-alg2 TaxID=3242693 RepID=UPI00359E7B07
MQTFLPFPDFAASATALDDRRLGKQRVETLQILRALHLDGYGWRSHPAVTMWRGHTAALVAYGLAVVDAWTDRGHADTTRALMAEFVHPGVPATQRQLARTGGLPPWLGWEPLHRSHRSALVRKDPDHYRTRFPDVPDDLDYVWPQPPAAAAGPGRREAWVVRGEVRGGEVAVVAEPGEDPWVPLDARPGRLTKRLRQAARLVEEIVEGDVLLVPDGADLRVARVTGNHRLHDGHHVRRVRWLGRLPRAALDFPAALQDPQTVFPLHDEPAVRVAAGHAADTYAGTECGTDGTPHTTAFPARSSP